MTRIAVLTLTLLTNSLLSGCAPNTPQYSPSAFLDSQYNYQKGDFQIGEHLVDSGRLAFVITSNTRKSIAFYKDYEKDVKNALIISDRDTALSGLDASKISNDFALLLKRLFKNVVYSENISDAKSKGASQIVVLDLRYSMPLADMANYSSNWDADLYFIKPDGTPVSLISSSVRKPCPGGDEFWPCNDANRQSLINDLSGKLAVAVQTTRNPDEKTSESNIEIAKYQDVLQSGTDTQLYSLGLSLEQDGKIRLANQIYQILVKRFPNSLYSAKAIEHQETFLQDGK